ncbi:c-type cytochrome [Marivirga tractuosa]|nr:cytochrome c [Marivirga tractuosa]
MKFSRILLIISLFIFFGGCEYERIAGPNGDCDASSFELIIESVKNTACNEAAGEIELSVTGDIEVEYKLNDGDFTEDPVFTSLSAGNYSVQARSISSNCVSEQIEVTIDNIDGLQISVAEKDNSNCGDNTGKIIVEQQGGVEPIEYIINENEIQGSPEFTGLSNGNYTIVARDANGCEAEISGIEILSGISFNNDIKAIISANCAISGCHNGTQSPNFTIDNNIIQNASRIKTRTGNGSMPPAGRPDLSNDEIQAIACWVDDGALNN